MKLLKLPKLALLLVIAITVATPSAGQQKRQTADKTPTKTAVAPAQPPPTFETLLAADSYKIYGEVRGVGQLIRSNAINDVLEPVLKLAGPPKEFKSVVKWINAHADEVMTSRLLVAAWPTFKDVPDVVIAIEFATPEDAAKFEPQLNRFMPSILPPKPAESPSDKEKPAAGPPTPGYHLRRTGSLVILTPNPLELKKLKPTGSKLLFQDPNFRLARNRFNSESIFVFVDVKAIEKENQERQKQYEEANKKLAEEMRSREGEQEAEAEQQPDTQSATVFTVQEMTTAGQILQVASPPPPDPISVAMQTLAFSFFKGESHWPDGIGIGLSLENDSFDLRALMVNAAGENSDLIPFIPTLIAGPPIAPESPNILPADTQLFVTLSLDFPQIHGALSKQMGGAFQIAKEPQPSGIGELESPIAALERQLKIKIKDELLPLLGSELAFSLPVAELDIVGPPSSPAPPPQDQSNKDNSTAAPPARPGPLIAISLKDKEGMRRLLPKLIEGLGLKGAMALAQTERREDTELVSFANTFAYAFVGDFLILSGAAATTRHVVDSYLKRETLAGDVHFKNYTRWQPRQLQGHVYLSPALMESYKSWADSSNALVSEQVKTFVSRLSPVAQPVTYSLSNDGLGSLHELHVPKNLVLMAIAGIVGETNPPPMVQNERITIGALSMIGYAQERYKNEKGGTYASLEQLLAEEMVPKDMIEGHGYKFAVAVTGDSFEASAVPIEYGKTGKLSYFMDQTRVLRGGDHGGGPATVADQPIR